MYAAFIYFNLNKLMNYYYYLDEHYYSHINTHTNTNLIVYIGELPPSVDQFELHQFISTKGTFNIQSLYVKNNYNQSFAYVKFKTPNEAEKAIQALHMQNFKDYIIKAEHFKYNNDHNDKAKTEGNVVVKHLPTNTTPKELYKMFAQFGNVVSINLRKDVNGCNTGVGFVNFDKAENAVNAVDKVNMTTYKGNVLKVKLHTKRDNNNTEHVDSMLLVKHVPNDIECDEQLKEVFGSYGSVVTCGIIGNDVQQERMGVVVYARREETEHAFNAFNNNNNKGYDVVMTPIDNEVIDKVKGNEMKKELCKKKYNDAVKLNIKNIPHEISEEELCDVFKQYGDVLNAKIQNDNKGLDNAIINNKCGYVLFKNAHDAKKAQSVLNNVDYEYKGVKMKLQIEHYNHNTHQHQHHQQQQPFKYHKKNKYNNYPTRHNKQQQQHNTHYINNSNNKYSSIPNDTFPMNALPITTPSQTTYINTNAFVQGENNEQRITVEGEGLVDKVKEILQIENTNERTEALGEVLFYFLMKFIPQYKLNITEGKCSDTTISSKLTGILIRTNANNLLEIISTTTHLKNSLQDILLKLIQANRLYI